MRTAALIVAAGMSKRMGQFKPLMPIGDSTVARRVVDSLRRVGAEPIVMVTGFRAEELEAHLADRGVVFLRNPDYETTQMFDSVKIGLAYLKDKCDRILFTPVDVPLFTVRTPLTLLKSGARLACPVTGGRIGHPIVISAALVDGILADCGERGLKGALDRCPEPLVHIQVEDFGSVQDADTPEDFSTLLDYHSRGGGEN